MGFTFCRRDKSLALAGIQTPECPDSNLVTILSYPGSFCSGRTWSFITKNITTVHSQQVSNISDTCCVGDWATSRARSDSAREKICPTRNQTWIPVWSRLYSRCYWACYPSISSSAGCQNSIVSILITWWATQHGFQFPIFLFPNCLDQLWGQPSLPFNWHQELFFYGYSGRGVKLTTHLHLMLSWLELGQLYF